MKAYHLTPLSFSPIQSNAKESIVSYVQTAATSLEKYLDALLPILYAFRTTFDTHSPYLELLDSERMIVSKSCDGTHLG